MSGTDEYETRDEAKKPMHWASYWGELEEMKRLLELGEDVNRYGAEPLVMPG